MVQNLITSEQVEQVSNHAPSIQNRFTLGGELGASFAWYTKADGMIRTFIPQGTTPDEIRCAAQALLRAADRWDDNASGGT